MGNNDLYFDFCFKIINFIFFNNNQSLYCCKNHSPLSFVVSCNNFWCFCYSSFEFSSGFGRPGKWKKSSIFDLDFLHSWIVCLLCIRWWLGALTRPRRVTARSRAARTWCARASSTTKPPPACSTARSTNRPALIKWSCRRGRWKNFANWTAHPNPQTTRATATATLTSRNSPARRRRESW